MFKTVKHTDAGTFVAWTLTPYKQPSQALDRSHFKALYNILMQARVLPGHSPDSKYTGSKYPVDPITRVVTCDFQSSTALARPKSATTAVKS